MLTVLWMSKTMVGGDSVSPAAKHGHRRKMRVEETPPPNKKKKNTQTNKQHNIGK